jgi:hypothetical protein
LQPRKMAHDGGGIWRGAMRGAETIPVQPAPLQRTLQAGQDGLGGRGGPLFVALDR